MASKQAVRMSSIGQAVRMGGGILHQAGPEVGAQGSLRQVFEPAGRNQDGKQDEADHR